MLRVWPRGVGDVKHSRAKSSGDSRASAVGGRVELGERTRSDWNGHGRIGGRCHPGEADVLRTTSIKVCEPLQRLTSQVAVASNYL